MKRVDPPEEIADLDELLEVIHDLAEAHNELADEVERIDTNANGLANRVRALGGQVDKLEEHVADVDDRVELVDATMPDQQKNKLERVEAILQYAYEHAEGGMGGVKVTTGEATAAASSSRSTARRAMDFIGSAFPWAETHTPGGPKPKELRIDTDASLQDRLADARDHFGGQNGGEMA